MQITQNPSLQSHALVRRFADAIFTVNSKGFFLIAALLFSIEVIILFLIIDRVPYTEIDWSTYMQQVQLYIKGQRNYTKISGDTGPLVYPAGHLRIYSLFYHLTNEGKNIRVAQYIFAAAYLLTLLLIFRIYYCSRRIPPFVLPLICLTSYRVHSIFVLRLFNDPIAMLFFFIATNLLISRKWRLSLVFYSFAVSIKMNILLFAPAFFFALLMTRGAFGIFRLLIIAAFLQICVAFDFIFFDPFAYVSRAFDFKRIFLFEWTVNWRFLPEAVFLDRRFHCALLIAHLTVLTFFATKFWFRGVGGLPNALHNLWLGVRWLQIDTHDILFALFTSNLIGMAFARSLHYQFYCWYYHSIPYLLFSPLYPPHQRKMQQIPIKEIFFRVSLMLGIELCWNVFPSTAASSFLLQIFHLSLFLLLFKDSYSSSKKNE